MQALAPKHVLQPPPLSTPAKPVAWAAAPGREAWSACGGVIARGMWHVQDASACGGWHIDARPQPVPGLAHWLPRSLEGQTGSVSNAQTG